MSPSAKRMWEALKKKGIAKDFEHTNKRGTWQFYVIEP
jgi:hypothetical protein